MYSGREFQKLRTSSAEVATWVGLLVFGLVPVESDSSTLAWLVMVVGEGLVGVLTESSILVGRETAVVVV